MKPTDSIRRRPRSSHACEHVSYTFSVITGRKTHQKYQAAFFGLHEIKS